MPRPATNRAVAQEIARAYENLERPPSLARQRQGGRRRDRGREQGGERREAAREGRQGGLERHAAGSAQRHRHALQEPRARLKSRASGAKGERERKGMATKDVV